MSNSLCFYHSADLDGKCSGAIVKQVFSEIELVPFNYNNHVDWSKINKETTVYMVDVSLSRDDMIHMKNETNRFVWIDHHISKIEEVKDIQFDGIQKSGVAACELVWEYFFRNHGTLPTAVKLLSDYDVWKISPMVLEFQYGLRRYDCNPSNQVLWDKLFNNEFFTQQILKEGRLIYDYVKIQDKSEVTGSAFITSFRDYRVLAVNKAYCSSLFFDTHPECNKVDMLVAFSWNGKSWKFSFYTNKDNLDVSKICQEFGGGGHKKAAGIFLDTLPVEIEKMMFTNE